ncbi:MAG: ABC transporter substrate-binding protein [Burkholderiales bacterium]|nr:ABC transporter substrate-binding protein [Burkholderiales bacterium]
MLSSVLASATRAFSRVAPIVAALLIGTGARAEIVVGQVAPFSGPQAVTGKAIHAGAKLYFDSVNASGGVRGQQIRLVTKDDGQKSEETVRLINELIRTDAPIALLGTVGTSNLEALAKDGVLQRTHVPMVGAVSGASSVTQAPGMLVVKASYREEVDRLFTVLSRLQIKRVGLVYQDDSLGKDVLEGAALSATRHTIDLVARTGYARNTVDTSVAVAKMLEASPQAIFLGATTAAAIDFTKRYRAAGGCAQIYGMSIIDTEALLKALGPDGARGYAFSIVLPLQTQTKLALVREYVALRAASSDTNLSARSIEGYIAAKALVWALNKSPRPTPEAIAQTLAARGGFDAGGFQLDFSQPSTSGSHVVDFAMFGKGGKIVQ